MEPIASTAYTISFENEVYPLLNAYLKETKPSRVVVLVDSNTQTHCLPLLLNAFEAAIEPDVICVEAGEEHKTLSTCMAVWEKLSALQIDRKALLINLGGGVVCDLGGFVASTYLRGIPFVHIPTSLLAMVDASVGSKTGVDFNFLKNQIGVFAFPKAVIIDVDYLKTLPKPHFNAGLAEMWKHGLIASESYWKQLCNLPTSTIDVVAQAIHTSVAIKNEVVANDPYEQLNRKILNFGHTLGHAVESYFLSHKTKQTLLHGEADALGMLLEGYLSHLEYNFPKAVLHQLYQLYTDHFNRYVFDANEIDDILKLLVYDKKNDKGRVNFVLLKEIGQPVIDCSVSETQLREAFTFFNTLC